MKHFLLPSAILLGSAVTATAGNIDRSGQSITALFEEGRYGEFSFGSVSPSVSGTSTAGLGSVNSGDISPSYLQFGAAYKADINDKWSYAIIFDQPYGADTAYALGTGYFAQGANAELKSNALTGILRYKMPSNFSIHGGLRVQTLEATANIPFVSNYAVTGERDVGIGYLVGAAYERPDIALRVSLTYNSEIEHEVDTVETSTALGGPNSSVTTVDTPQSLNLEFQTGIAADTLLFGGVRWTDWSEFNISPANYGTLTGGGSLLSYNDDVYTWTLGVGRRLNETWSIAGLISYEEQTGGFFTNLGPADGATSVGLAATYTKDNMKITTGIRYVNVGSAQTAIPGNAPAANFRNNDALAIGVKVGFSF